jgi:DNA-directed RNA polymerase specialized sigma24 family protein
VNLSEQFAPVSLASMLQELGSVVSRNLPMFYKRAFRFLGNAPDAEDAVQDGLESKVIGLCRLAVLRLGTRLRLFVSFWQVPLPQPFAASPYPLGSVWRHP